MKSKEWKKPLVSSFAVVALCATLNLGTTVSAQSPPGPPPDIRLATLQPPQAIKQAEPEKQPGKAAIPGKEAGPEKGPLPKLLKEAAQEKGPPPKTLEQIAKSLPVPKLEPGEEGLVINLPTALRLANASAWDIKIATEQLLTASALLQQAQVLWLPTLVAGTDYQYHSGPIQEVPGDVIDTNRGSLYSGAAPLAIFALTDAIFAPLAQRQEVRAQDANIQTARNDTLTDLAEVYFNLLEAEADLASIVDVDRRAAEMVKIAETLTPGIMPPVELARTRAAKFNIEQVVETARQRWRNASAEVARIARLKPTVVLQPMEPPHMKVTLVPSTMRPEELIPIALTRRPELTFFQAQAEAARQRERQEKWRPFLPTAIIRGGGTTPPFPMAVGSFGGGVGSGLGSFAERSDWDFSVVWTLQNMGLGNLALIRQRKAEYDLARSREYRFADVVAREVTVAWDDVQSAERRISQTERELRQAELSAKLNLEAMGEVKRLGAILIQVIRPLEVVASLQALNQAYFDYYGVIAEYNRAQFRLYRALGNPAQLLQGLNSLGGPHLDKNLQK